MPQPRIDNQRGIWLALALLGLLVLTGISRARSHADSPKIHLKNITIDPERTDPLSSSLTNGSVGSSKTDISLIQFTGPVQPAWKQAVEQAGVRLYHYVPDFAFVARFDPIVVSSLEKLPFIRWVGPYLPAYRLSPSLANLDSSGESLQGKTAGVTLVDVQILPDTDADIILRQVGEWGGSEIGRSLNPFIGYLRLALNPSFLVELAALPGVLWVEPSITYQLHNDVAGGGILRADALRTALGLYGQGQIVAVADTGLDNGDLEGLHPDLRGRVLWIYCLGRPSPCEWSDYTGHGTHVTGSVLGNGVESGSQPANHTYAGSYAGLAPEALLVFQSLADARGGLSGLPLDLGDLIQQAYETGARIHTNSWGMPALGAYTTSSQQIDRAIWELQNILVLFSAGNDGTDVDRDGVIDLGSIAAPATAKNVIAVGASENDRAFIDSLWGTTYGEPIASDRRADNTAGMAAFSSRGPADDGRIKPDLVAPGTYVVSTRSHQPVYQDDLEGDTSGFLLWNFEQGAGDNWHLVTEQAHSPNHSWTQTVVGTFSSGRPAALFTPILNALPAGNAIDLYFWQKYHLRGDDHLRLLFTDASMSAVFSQALAFAGDQVSFEKFHLKISLAALSAAGIDPATLRIGFAIDSDDQIYNSQWWVDDLLLDGVDWGSLSDLGLAVPGSNIDEAYQAMGGTSMAAPLSAGTAVLVREWLARFYGFSNPSAALLKAMLVNGAVHRDPGQYGDGITREIPAVQPNNISGWGFVNLTESLNPPAPREIWAYDDPIGFQTGDKEIFTLSIGNLPPVKQPEESDTKLVPGSGLSIKDHSHSTLVITPTTPPQPAPTQTSTPPPIPTLPVLPSPPATAPPQVSPTAPLPPPMPSGGPLRVTLVWSDPPALSLSGKALVNDLDLEVISPDGKHYYGNTGVYLSGECLRAGKWDACNNVEGVTITSAYYGLYQVLVHGFNVPMGAQPFAIVASGDYLREGDGPPITGSSIIYLPVVVR